MPRNQRLLSEHSFSSVAHDQFQHPLESLPTQLVGTVYRHVPCTKHHDIITITPRSATLRTSYDPATHADR